MNTWSTAYLSFYFYATLNRFASPTEIRWIPGDQSENEAAKAPRSQKYWDEHNIALPDYAKTDAEVAKERLTTTFRNNYSTFVVLAAIMTVFSVMIMIPIVRESIKGHRLDGGSSFYVLLKNRIWTINENDMAERSREARLARFESDSMVVETEKNEKID